MESRLSHYESRLTEHEVRLNALSATRQPLSPTTQTMPTSSMLNLPGLLMSNTPLQKPLPEMGPPSVPSAPTGLDFINQASSAFGGPSASPSGLSTTSFPDTQILPSADIVNDLICLYWAHIHPWAPILAPAPVPFAPPWNIVVHAIVVLSLRLSNDVRLEGRKEMYKRAAKQHILAHAIESTSISSVQALALLALDLIGSDQGPSSWGLLALLTRSAVHLGLTSEDDSLGSSSSLVSRAPAPSLSRTSIIPPAADWADDESRRRLFWLIFALDRYACVATGWDFALPDFDIKRRLPCADEIWAHPVSLLAVSDSDDARIGLSHLNSNQSPTSYDPLGSTTSLPSHTSSKPSTSLVGHTPSIPKSLILQMPAPSIVAEMPVSLLAVPHEGGSPTFVSAILHRMVWVS